MRIILYTGKGGVGKTSIAAATALRCAEIGHSTLILSTDSAHSLADSFDQEIGDEVTPIVENLSGEEINVNHEIKKNWEPIQTFLGQFLRHQGFEDVIADELAVLPGMEEVFSLLELKNHYLNNHFEVIIVDCAPTGDTIRLLSVPDIANWYIEKIFNIHRTIFKAARPVAKYFVDMPLPTDDVFHCTEGLYRNLIGMKEILSDREISSLRMVVNPEKMVIKEAQRAYTFINLFGFSADAVIVNRILPEEIQDPYYVKWKELQGTYLKEVEDSFQPLPIFTSRLWDQEVVGLNCLSQMAREIYGDQDPATLFFQEKPIEIVGSEGGYSLLVRLPFATRELLDMWVKGDELVIKFKNYKRNIFLPRMLSRLKLKGAKLEDKVLNVRFGGDM